MELFIRVDQSGNAVDHPIFRDNFCEAFPNIDPENLPSEFARFVRVPRPTLKVYEVLVNEDPTYQLVDGVFQDVWAVRSMTDAEKLAKQQAVQDEFRSRRQADNWAAWVFDAETCCMQPPISRPLPNIENEMAGIFTFWCGAENMWKDTPPHPVDGGQYEFDFFAWQWIPAVN